MSAAACDPPSLGPPGPETLPSRGTARRQPPTHSPLTSARSPSLRDDANQRGGRRRRGWGETGAGEGGRGWEEEEVREPNDHLKR